MILYLICLGRENVLKITTDVSLAAAEVGGGELPEWESVPALLLSLRQCAGGPWSFWMCKVGSSLGMLER